MISAAYAQYLTGERRGNVRKLILQAIVDGEYEVAVGHLILTHEQCESLRNDGFKLIPYEESGEINKISWE